MQQRLMLSLTVRLVMPECNSCTACQTLLFIVPWLTNQQLEGMALYRQPCRKTVARYQKIRKNIQHELAWSVYTLAGTRLAGCMCSNR